MPPKKKSRKDVIDIPTIVWQRLSADGTHYITFPTTFTDTIEPLLKEGKNPQQTITVDNTTFQVNMKDMTAVEGTAAAVKIRRLQKGLWEYPDDQGIYTQLYDEDNDLIEDAWRKCTESTDGVSTPFSTQALSWNKGYSTVYTFTFSAPTVYPPSVAQKNNDSGRVRDFKRQEPDAPSIKWDLTNFGIQGMTLDDDANAGAGQRKVCAGAAEDKVDETVAAAPAAPSAPIQVAETAASLVAQPAMAVGADIFQPPATWAPQTMPIERFLVQPGTDEYKTVTEPFIQKLKTTTTIKSVHRLQNKLLWKFYALTRHKVALRNNGNPNERLLFHGARVKENMDAITNFGFDMRVARNGLAGVGIYFAVHSSYSNSGYVYYDQAKKEKQMLVCRVTVGSCTKGKHGLVRPPPKSKKKGDTGDLYDSVHNNEDVMYIVFDNTQAYPEYVITYAANNAWN